MANDPKEQGAQDSAQGKMDKVTGRVKDAVGGLTGDAKLQAEGKLDQAKGTAKDIVGKAERKVGDDLE